ncbi:hypothetical protein PR048_008865 [Dryococelus australis]|uniref:DDE-1 domain-containing protein n=1 Tax=Dryococelus australis TaxID=614101 RepID=A0ABQ9HYB4_9NEOP|nr:hypothetical protein PR048_008865 [Dryococelus australis]
MKRDVLSLADKIKILEQLDKGARHGIPKLDLSGEKLSADPKAAENFIEKFKIEAKSYDPEFLYNADQTGLIWKALPKTTLASKRETSYPGDKVNKVRVTVLNCANSTGNHKMPLLLIGKSKNPRAFKNVKKLPLFYKNRPKAWMTAALFTEWYDSIVIPEVKKYQKAIGKLTFQNTLPVAQRNKFGAASGPIGYRNYEATLLKTTVEEACDRR